MTAVVKVRVTPPQSVHVVTTPPPTLRVITGGIRGASAYESALTHGFVGTEAEWLASLAGGGTSIEGIADVPGLTAALAGKQPTGAYVLDSDGRLSDARTPTVHGHGVADVTGLTAALDGKQAAGSYAAASHTHTLAQVTDYLPPVVSGDPAAIEAGLPSGVGQWVATTTGLYYAEGV